MLEGRVLNAYLEIEYLLLKVIVESVITKIESLQIKERLDTLNSIAQIFKRNKHKPYHWQTKKYGRKPHRLLK